MFRLNLLQVLAPLFVYLVPIGFFIYMGIDVLLRNTRKVEHRLVSIIIGCYILLFLEEYVRNQLPIEYSPILVAIWFGNVGAMIPSVGIHFIIKFSRLDKKMPRYIYPYFLYLPVILVLLTIIESENIFNSQQFIQMGMWKVPVFNRPYLTAQTIGNILCVLYLILLLKGKSNANTKEQKGIFNLLIYAVFFVLIWNLVFGYINFGGSLPPHPYIFAGVFWCFFLRIAMKRYDFLNFYGKRYEILFNLNPAAILLVDLSGRIKEANPSAKQLFHHFDLDRIPFYDLLLPEDKNQWARIFSNDLNKTKKIKDFETTIYIQYKKLDVLIDGDCVLVENEPHFILILRDVTVQKENQKEITFLAYHDPLTRLPNRRYFYEKLEEAIYKAKVHKRKLAVLIIDLDHFKETNDKFGHKAGDELLQHVSKIINEASAHEGMAGRLGGDEFIIFLEHIPTVQFVEESIQRLQCSFKQNQFIYEGNNIPIELSIGVSLFPDDGTDGEILVNNADKAMYRVKRNGRNHFMLSR